MGWLLFIIYLSFFSWMLTRLRFVSSSGLSNKMIICLFIIKIVAGIIYFQFHSLPDYKERSDTWKFYNNSLTETQQLKTDPIQFVTDFFTSGYKEESGLFSNQNSYWNDLKDASIIKLMAVVNLFTGNNYHCNIIFFNFLFFIGLIAFYRLMKSIYKDKHYSLIFSIFLIPSFLFWCSGIHKDGLIFSAIGLTQLCFHRILNKERTSKSIIVILVCFTVIFFLRNYLVLILLPAMMVGYMVSLYPKRRFLVLLVSFLAGMIFIFSAKYLHPSLNVPKYIANKQHQFKSLEGSSAVSTDLLQPDLKSFITALPSAIDIGFFRPHPGEKGLISISASLEIIFFWLTVILCIIYRNKTFSHPPIIWTTLIFSFLVLIIIGYTVHFSGAVVRYRSLILPLLLGPLVGAAKFKSNIIKNYM